MSNETRASRLGEALALLGPRATRWEWRDMLGADELEAWGRVFHETGWLANQAGCGRRPPGECSRLLTEHPDYIQVRCGEFPPQCPEPALSHHDGRELRVDLPTLYRRLGLILGLGSEGYALPGFPSIGMLGHSSGDGSPGTTWFCATGPDVDILSGWISTRAGSDNQGRLVVMTDAQASVVASRWSGRFAEYHVFGELVAARSGLAGTSLVPSSASSVLPSPVDRTDERDRSPMRDNPQARFALFDAMSGSGTGRRLTQEELNVLRESLPARMTVDLAGKHLRVAAPSAHRWVDVKDTPGGIRVARALIRAGGRWRSAEDLNSDPELAEITVETIRDYTRRLLAAVRSAGSAHGFACVFEEQGRGQEWQARWTRGDLVAHDVLLRLP